MHPFIKQYQDVDLKSELACLIHKAVNQNELDLDKQNDESIIQVIREKSNEPESELSEDATTPLSILQDNSLSFVEIPHMDQPLPAINCPERCEDVIIPQVALNVYQKQRQMEEEQAEMSDSGEEAKQIPLQTLHIPEDYEEEEIPIQDVTLIPPDSSITPTTLNSMQPLFLPTSDQQHTITVTDWQGSGMTEVESLQLPSTFSEREYEMSDFSPAGTPRLTIPFMQVEEPREVMSPCTHVIYPYLLKHTNTMLTDDLCEVLSVGDEEVPEENSLMLEEIEDPLFMYPKLSSEKKLLYSMVKPKRSWKQKIIRKWNRFVRKCFGKKKKSSANRRCCW